MSSTIAYINLEDAERAADLEAARGLPTISAAALGAMVFPPIRWIVPDILPEGCTILAGRPKLGKSWLALDIALAVARGEYCLGDRHCAQGDALYLALEDNSRRLQSRVTKVSPPHTANPWPERLDFATAWKRCDDGGLDMLETWVNSKEHPRLIIVDVLAQFRSGRGNTDTLYESDYAAVKGLQELAGRHGLGVLVVHHVRKGSGDIDPFERVSGTMGLTGAADLTMVLDRDGQGCSLYARGRDMQEYTNAVAFNQECCRWTIQGEASEVRRTDERSTILDALSGAEEAMSPVEIADATGMARNNVRQLLFKMAKAGEVIKVKRGRYAVAGTVAESE